MLKRVLVALCMGLVAVGLMAGAQSLVTPRNVGVLLFDNETGGAVSKLAITFDREVELDASDVIVFGGEAATLVAASNYFVWIQVVVDAGGTLQLAIPDPETVVVDAFWF